MPVCARSIALCQPERLLSACNFLPTTAEIARQAGTWRYDFARDGVTLSTTDALVAATAEAHSATIVTGNLKDYSNARNQAARLGTQDKGRKSAIGIGRLPLKSPTKLGLQGTVPQLRRLLCVRFPGRAPYCGAGSNVVWAIEFSACRQESCYLVP